MPPKQNSNLSKVIDDRGIVSGSPGKTQGWNPTEKAKVKREMRCFKATICIRQITEKRKKNCTTFQRREKSNQESMCNLGHVFEGLTKR